MLSCSLLEADENSRRVRSKILVVDDNFDVRRLLLLHLQQSSYDTVKAATGVEAVQQAHATHPDLILMDLATPGGNGDEAIAALKADPLTRDIPVVVLTAFRPGALVDRVIAAGAAEILHKPVNLKLLDLVVQRYLRPASNAPNPANVTLLRSSSETQTTDGKEPR
jgi:two-component system, cell cycle response regulator